MLINHSSMLTQLNHLVPIRLGNEDRDKYVYTNNRQGWAPPQPAYSFSKLDNHY